MSNENTIVQCDYHISKNCYKEMLMKNATVHDGFVDKPNLIKFACSNCENCFDE